MSTDLLSSSKEAVDLDLAHLEAPGTEDQDLEPLSARLLTLCPRLDPC